MAEIVPADRHSLLGGQGERLIASIAGVLGIVAGVHLLFSIFLNAFFWSFSFDGYFANGAFQLFNPLRRLADGQAPGRDFQVFHGVGTAYLHYPLYLLLGKNLFASEMARHLVSPILFLASNFLFFMAATRKVVLSLWLSILSYFVGLAFFAYLLYPGNSLMGARCALPIVAGALVMAAPWLKERFGSLRFPVYETLLALVLAASFFVATEQGLAIISAWVVLQAALLISSGGRMQRVRELFVVLSLCVLHLAIFYLLVSGRDFLSPIRYALVDIPSDQFWYFGAPPNAFYHDVSDLFLPGYLRSVYLTGTLLFAVVVAVALLLKRRDAQGPLFLLLYGLISMASVFGYISDAYAQPLARVCFLAAVWLFVVVLPEWLGSVSNDRARRKLLRGCHSAVLCLAVLLGVVRFDMTWPSLRAQAEMMMRFSTDQSAPLVSGVWLQSGWAGHMKSAARHIDFAPEALVAWNLTDHNWQRGVFRRGAGFFTPPDESLKRGDRLVFASGPRTIETVEHTGRWTNIWLDGEKLDPKKDGFPNPIYREHPSERPPVLWSTYAGLPEARLGTFHPSFDYIIHAVGEGNRAQYLKRFEELRPEFVRTDNTYQWGYGEWLLNTSWDFYALVVDNYRILEKDFNGILWQRKEDEWRGGNQPQGGITILPESAGRIEIPMTDVDESQVLIVTVHYEVRNRWSFVPFFGNLPRYLLFLQDARSSTPVSLPPGRNELTFPVVTRVESRPVLVPRVLSMIPGAELNVKEITYRKLHLNEQNRGLFFEDEPPSAR